MKKAALGLKIVRAFIAALLNSPLAVAGDSDVHVDFSPAQFDAADKEIRSCVAQGGLGASAYPECIRATWAKVYAKFNNENQTCHDETPDELGYEHCLLAKGYVTY